MAWCLLFPWVLEFVIFIYSVDFRVYSLSIWLSITASKASFLFNVFVLTSSLLFMFLVSMWLPWQVRERGRESNRHEININEHALHLSETVDCGSWTIHLARCWCKHPLKCRWWWNLELERIIFTTLNCYQFSVSLQQRWSNSEGIFFFLAWVERGLLKASWYATYPGQNLACQNWSRRWQVLFAILLESWSKLYHFYKWNGFPIRQHMPPIRYVIESSMFISNIIIMSNAASEHLKFPRNSLTEWTSDFITGPTPLW
jgi:hypothetical protein